MVHTKGMSHAASAAYKKIWELMKLAAETILRLRNHVLESQSRIRLLEAELTVQTASQQLRLARYQEVYYKAAWIELEIQE